MTPVTNKPPMPQAPGKGIKSFPTPVIDDVVITEIVNAWKGDYKALDYGVKWDEAPHASMQGSHPDHKLVFQDPVSADGEWIKRIWVNDRVNQDSYNYAIKYSGGSQSHPIYIRTYILPREGYVPVPDLTPDDVYPTALLVEEEVQRSEGELDSKYIKVVRVFETLQGPEINSLRYNERGDLEEVISQQVSPDTLPDSDGLLVTQSQVIKEDVSKGTKTTATVPSHSTLTSKEKKAGLLGETFITDNIVDPTTLPDALSTTVISSSVEQTSKTKARKRTVTSTGPSALSVDSMVDSPVGLVKANVTKSIVAKGTIPSLPTSSPDKALRTIKETITSIDSAKSEKEIIEVEKWPKNYGVDYDDQLGLGIYYTETVVKPSAYLDASDWASLANKSYKPLDNWKSVEKAIDQERVGNALLSLWLKTQVTQQIQLPDQLLGITVYWGKSYGEGDSFDTSQSVTSGSFSLSSSGSSKNSYGINGDLYFNIQKGFNGAIKAYKHIFFMKVFEARSSEENILDILNNFELYNKRSTEYSIAISSVKSDSGKLYVTTVSPHGVTNLVNFCEGTATGDAGGLFSYAFSGIPEAVDSNTFTVPASSGSFPEKPASGRVKFFIKKGFPPSSIIGKYKPWPYMQERTENIVVISGGKSETFNASTSESVSINGVASGKGGGSSIDVNVSANSVNIPTTLHGKITIKEESFGKTGSSKLEPTYGIRPMTLEPTKVMINGKLAEASSFPLGNYLFSSNVEIYKWGFVKVEAITVEITKDFV
jgi:hypothetical protein